jgi:AraC-like DNA-binding protein
MKAPLQERIFHPTYLRLLCLHIRGRGASSSDALAGTGMTWSQLLHEKRLIPFTPARALVLSAKRLSECKTRGLEFGHSVEIAAHGLAGTAIATSPDLSEALRAAIRYRPLRGRAVEFGLRHDEHYLVLRIHEPFDFEDMRTFVLEAQAAMLDRIMVSIAGGPLVGIEYHFPSAPPTWAGEYSRWFSGEVHFWAPHMEVRVPKALLSLPNVMSDEQTRAAVIFSAERELVLRLSDSNFVAQIRRRLLEQQGCYPSVQTMAHEFHMSPRTLLRKLKQDRASYQELLDDARKEEAEWYLLKTHLRIEAIAERLGYIDASGFNRAFRRWFGKSPGTFRKRRQRTNIQA